MGAPTHGVILIINFSVRFSHALLADRSRPLFHFQKYQGRRRAAERAAPQCGENEMLTTACVKLDN
jgi:hypothetical protein